MPISKRPKEPEVSTCVFSPDRAYRYSLTHSWRDPNLPSYVPSKWAVWIGLNPSTADEAQLDATLRRVKAFSRSWLCDGFIMLNLFAFRSTNPNGLLTVDDPIGPDNDRHIVEATRGENVTCVVAMWGNHGRLKGRDGVVQDMLVSKLTCLGTNRDGSPKHCLYLPKTAQRQPFGYSYPVIP